MSEAVDTLSRDAATSGANLAKVEIETKSDTLAFECRPDQTLLAGALAAGFSLPYGCATGTCGTCRARVMEGEADPGWPEAPGYRRLKRDKGDILLCQATVRDACFLKVPTTLSQPAALAPRRLERTGIVTSTKRLTRDILEFELELSEAMDFDAGQFVTIRHPNVIGSRAYSMVNYGAASQRLTFVVKRKPNGAFSNFLFDTALEGIAFDLLGPLGSATFRPKEGHDFLCVAGGSGIAGMMAMLRHASDERYFGQHRGHVFFGVRTVEDAFYLEDFAEHIIVGNGGLAVTIAISDEGSPPDCHPAFSSIRLAKGMVHEVAAATMNGQWKNAVGFVAGPPPMVDASLAVLIGKAGIAPQHIRFDKFS